MTQADDQAVLDFVDRVLIDLARPDAIFVGRRPGVGAPGTVVIQSGEEGRYQLPLPDPASGASIEALVMRLQEHVSDVSRTPVPACPVHGHALICQAIGDTVRWECTDGEWSSPVGE